MERAVRLQKSESEEGKRILPKASSKKWVRRISSEDKFEGQDWSEEGDAPTHSAEKGLSISPC